MNKKILGYTLVGVVASSVAGYFAFRNTNHPHEQVAVTRGVSTPATVPPVKDVGPRAECAFKEGDRLAYNVNIDVDANVRAAQLGAAGGQDAQVKRQVATRVDLKAMVVDEAGAILLAKFSETSVDGKASKQLENPFLVRVNQGCSLTSFAYYKDTPVATARTQQSVVYELNVAWPAEENEAHENDSATGRYRGLYSVNTSGGDARIHWSKEKYLTLWGDSDDLTRDVRPAESDGVAEMGQGPWFKSIRQHEVLRGLGAADSDTQVSATEVETRILALTGASGNLTDYRWSNLLPRVITTRVSRPVTKRDLMERDAVKNDTIETAIALHIVRNREKVGFAQTWPPLTTYLEARPEQTEALVSALRSGMMPPEGRATAWVALGQARTPEALHALMDTMRDAQALPMDRARAMFAMVDRDDVGAPLAKEMADQAKASLNQASSGQKFVTRESRLALGVMGGLRAESDPEIQKVVVDAIPALLGGSNTAAELSSVFGMIGNLGNADTLSAVEPYTRVADVKVRQAAARTVRRMQPAETTLFLQKWLSIETDETVKREIYRTVANQTLDAHQPADTPVLDLAIRDLNSKPKLIERKNIIKVLGMAAKTYDPARRALMIQAKREFDARSGLYTLITRYLGANDLVSALQGAI